MTNKILLAGVSAVALALSASSAFAFFDNSVPGNDSTVNDNNNGIQMNNNDGILNTDNSNQSNDTSINSGNTGMIAGADNNVGSGNTTNIDNNGSGNTTSISGNGSNNTLTTKVSSIAIVDTDTSTDNVQDVDFKHSGAATASVLNSIVSENTVNFAPEAGATVEGNILVNSFGGYNGGVSYVQNAGMQNNVSGALTVHVGTVDIGNGN